MQIVRYNATLRQEWNRFVDNSRNGTFLINRDYMDYHADRFADHSLLFYHKNRLRCILPANEADSVLYSHQGLTYGGMILGADTLSAEVGDAFDALLVYMRENGFHSLLYKIIPAFYHRLPASEDAYFLFRNDARRIACALASTIRLTDLQPYSRERKRALRRADEAGVEVAPCDCMAEFWEVMESNMAERFDARPVHSVAEMQLLQSRFPEQIRLFGAFESGKLIAGALIYDTGTVIRIQYGHASARGKEVGALDAVYDFLIREFASRREYLDFGQCTEQNGHSLNKGLIHQKEGFGGRGTLYEIYQLEV